MALPPALCQRCGKLIGENRICPYCGASRGKSWKKRGGDRSSGKLWGSPNSSSSSGSSGSSTFSRWAGSFSFARKSMSQWISLFCIFIFVNTLLLSLFFFGLDGLLTALFRSASTKILFLSGLNSPALFEGRWWGLFTATFLHMGILHIGFNLYALSMLGPMIERHIGRDSFFILFLLSGLCGSALTAYKGSHAAGASTAIFGLIGAGIVICFFQGRGWKDPLLQNLLLWAGISFAIGLVPGLRLDNWGHLGGFIGGGFLSFIWLRIYTLGFYGKFIRSFSLFLLALTFFAYISCLWYGLPRFFY